MRRALAIGQLGPHIADTPRRSALGGWPIVVGPLALGAALIALRASIGPHALLAQDALVMLALVGLVSAAVLLGTNVLFKVQLVDRVGVTAAGLSFSFMVAAWMIRWIEAGDLEGWVGGRVWRYVPLDNLYALTLGFATCAALATLVVIRTPKHRAVGALALPFVALVLAVATLLDSEIHTLPPILSSYWLPIHVSTATIGYGVALTSFGIAVAYLVKDGLKSETMAIAVAAFGLLVYATIGRSGVLLGADYGVSLMVDHTTFPIRATIPYLGTVMALTLVALAGALVSFVAAARGDDEQWRGIGWRLFGVATALQAVVLAAFGFLVTSTGDLASRVARSQYPLFGQWLARQLRIDIDASQYTQLAENWMRLNGAELAIGLKSNPIELGALMTLFVSLALVGALAYKREAVTGSLPSLPTLDMLLYRSVGVVFPLLTLVLVTGAVWANESWGRYWGWDPKEVGALVAWLAYAGYLHARIVHGMSGRRSAYFALVGFALVVFTWLGVSFLLPGLHSYA